MACSDVLWLRITAWRGRENAQFSISNSCAEEGALSREVGATWSFAVRVMDSFSGVL